MNYIQQAFKGQHEWWQYILGIIIIFIGWQVIGAVPFSFVVFSEVLKNGGNILELNSADLLSVLEPNLNLFLTLLMFAFGLLALFLVVKFLHKLSLLKLTTTRKKIDWKRVFFSFFFWGIISSGLTLMDYYTNPESYVYNFEFSRFIVLAIIAIILVPIQTSFEEYLFRGYLMQGLGVIFKNKWLPLLLTSAVFGLLHIANPEIEQLGYILLVYYIGTGLFLGVITLMDDGLELAIGFHAANNLFTALLVTADWTAFKTHSILKDISEPEKAGFIDVFLPVFVIFPILLFIFSKKYKWTNWKEKLTGKVEPSISEGYKIIGDS